MICSACGGCFTDTSLAQSQFDRLYAEQSRYVAGPAAHSIETNRDRSRFGDVASYLSLLVPDRLARVLDVGCANGFMLRALYDRGYRELYGIDPSSACVSAANGFGGVVARVGALSTIPADLGQFDLIILSHVLEHVRDVGKSLAFLGPHSSAATLYYVEVPDASRYGDFVWSPFQDFNSEHINHFSVRSLTNLLGRAGFAVLEAGTKEILSAPNMPYPALFVVARADAAATSTVERDCELRDQLEHYMRISDRLMSGIRARLAEQLVGDRPVVVWGAGELMAKLLADSPLATAHIVGVVDSNPRNFGRTVRGIPVRPPDDLTSSNDLIVIGSLLHSASIEETIRKMGLSNPVLHLTPQSAEP